MGDWANLIYINQCVESLVLFWYESKSVPNHSPELQHNCQVLQVQLYWEVKSCSILCCWKLTKYLLQHSTLGVCTVCNGHRDSAAVGRTLHQFCARLLRGWLYSPSNCFITSNPLMKNTQPKSQQLNIFPLTHGSSQEKVDETEMHKKWKLPQTILFGRQCNNPSQMPVAFFIGSCFPSLSI